jgi:hypothetical protein
MPTLLALLAVAALPACKKTDGEVTWAVNYATVSPEGAGVTGVHVWEFFTEGWEKKRKEDYYSCAVVQSLTGTADAVPAGCEYCQNYYTLELVDQDGDCDASLSSDPALTGLRGFGVGKVPSEFSDEDPYPGDSMGWFISFDGSTSSFHGFIFDEGLERGDAGAVGWEEGATYTLWPAYAWAL